MASGDYLDAQLRFQEFLLQYPTYPGAHVNLAIIYASNGDDLGAENSITDALMLDPEHPAALNQLGMLQRRQGKFTEAAFAWYNSMAFSSNGKVCSSSNIHPGLAVGWAARPAYRSADPPVRLRHWRRPCPVLALSRSRRVQLPATQVAPANHEPWMNVDF